MLVVNDDQSLSQDSAIYRGSRVSMVMASDFSIGRPSHSGDAAPVVMSAALQALRVIWTGRKPVIQLAATLLRAIRSSPPTAPAVARCIRRPAVRARLRFIAKQIRSRCSGSEQPRSVHPTTGRRSFSTAELRSTAPRCAPAGDWRGQHRMRVATVRHQLAHDAVGDPELGQPCAARATLDSPCRRIPRAHRRR